MARRQIMLIGLALCATGLAVVVGCGGYEALLVPTRMRLLPGVVTAAPGEVVRYEIKSFSLVGIEIPLPQETAGWNLFDEALPENIQAPPGIRDSALAGVIDNSGRFEASPVVQPGHYRSGLVRATTAGTVGTLTASIHVIVDGDIDPTAPKLEVWPRNLRVPLGTTVPFVTLAIDPKNGRVAKPESQVWSVRSGGGIMAAETGAYTAATPAEEGDDTEVLVLSESGRRASTYLTPDSTPAGQLNNIHLVPEGTLKVALGRTQRFLLHGTDSDGRFLPTPDADWLVEGGIGTLTENDDGTVDFQAQAAGEGAIVVAKGGMAIRRSIIAVIPGA